MIEVSLSHWCFDVSLSLSLSLSLSPPWPPSIPLSLKSINIPSSEDLN